MNKNITKYVYRISLLILASTLFYGCRFQPKHIKPISSNIDINSLEDCTLNADFDSRCDLDLEKGYLTMGLYTEARYFADDITQMKEGDTISYGYKNTIIIKDINRNGDEIVINSGNADRSVCLKKSNNDTYVFEKKYYFLGKTTIPLAEDLVVIDSRNYYNSGTDTIRQNAKQYIASRREHYVVFHYSCTTVTIKNGFITQIERKDFYP